jgi:N-acetylglutamate synthase-like GNAT family acetyltransferase
MVGAAGDALAVARIAEQDIAPSLGRELEVLLQSCFPGYPARSYFKLPPHVRYVVRRDGAVVAQVGVELRMIRVGSDILRCVGVVDLCVSQPERSRGIATRLLTELTADAEERDIDFLLLFADDPRLYDRHGFVSVDNRCSWLKIDEHTTRGLAVNESLDGAMLVRSVAGRSWPAGDVDLLGHLF